MDFLSPTANNTNGRGRRSIESDSSTNRLNAVEVQSIPSSQSSNTPPVITLALDSGSSREDLNSGNNRYLQSNFSAHTLSPMVPTTDVLLPSHLDRNNGAIDFELLRRMSTELTDDTKVSHTSSSDDFVSNEKEFKINNFISPTSEENILKHQIQVAFQFGDKLDFERFVFYSEKLGTYRSKTIKGFQQKGLDLGEAIKSGGTFWLDITAPNTEDLNLLANVFKIHPLTVEDILTEEIREKCELFKNYYFVSIRTLITDSFAQSSLKSQNFYLLIFKNGIISFHSNMVPHINNVLKRITQLKDFIHLNSDWINYALIDDIIDGFGPILRQSELEVDTIDELVLILKESEQSDMLRRIGHARKRVTTLLRLLSTKPDVIKALTLRCGTEDRLASSTKTDIKLYLGDIQDHVLTMVQNCLHYEKVLSRAHSNYLAQISIELTQVSNRTNDVVAKLTVMASILLPMNVITGMWGMNVRVPGENVENLDWFFGICGCMLVLALSFLFIVRKYGFI